MSKTFWGVIVAVLVLLGGIFWATNSHNKTNGTASNAKPTQNVEGTSPLGVTLVEYGDFECPFCGQFYPIVKQVAAEYKDQVVFQFRNLPLQSIHKNAFAGARAAEAAALQGKFWEMHDQLYENQDPNGASGWVASDDPLTYFDQFAKTIGLNVSQFNTDYASEKVNDLVNADLNQFPKDFKAATGSYDPNKDMATPTYFLDGKHIQPGYSVADFEKFINAELAKKAAAKSGSSSQPAASSDTTAGKTNQ